MLDESHDIPKDSNVQRAGTESSGEKAVVARRKVVARLDEDINPTRNSNRVTTREAEIDRQKTLDQLRGRITLTLLIVCAALTVSVTFAAILANDDEWKRITAVIPYTITPFYTLLAVAAGYYFFHGKSR